LAEKITYELYFLEIYVSLTFSVLLARGLSSKLIKPCLDAFLIPVKSVVLKYGILEYEGLSEIAHNRLPKADLLGDSGE
jgi:hypothetical protein